MDQSATPARPKIAWRQSVLWGFFGVHAAALLTPFLVYTGRLEMEWRHWLVAITLFYLRAFFVAAGYHRYFSHRSFDFHPRLKWLGELILAVGTTSTAQRGPIWWAEKHRDHHKFSDQEGDHHSPIFFPYAKSKSRWVNLVKGCWWSHVGWILCQDQPSRSRATDLRKSDTLMWFEKNHLFTPIALGVSCLAIWGPEGLFAFFVSTMALWHATFTVNSVAHLVGSQRYATGDQSRNCWPLTFVVLGEQWHNNHHQNQGRERQGERWYEVDPTHIVLWTLWRVGIISRLNSGRL